MEIHLSCLKPSGFFELVKGGACWQGETRTAFCQIGPSWPELAPEEIVSQGKRSNTSSHIYNPCAHWRKPRDMMRQGGSRSLFQALQQWSRRSS